MEPTVPYGIFELPMRDGSRIRVRMHGNPTGPRMFVLHGNGFASDAYLPFWRYFTNRFDIVISDLRNHGQNPRSDPERHTFLDMVADLDAMVDGVEKKGGKKPRVGIFHSVSGLIAARAAKDLARRWDAVVLIDPPTAPKQTHPAYERASAFEDKLVTFALSRRRRFRQVDELAEEFRNSRVGAGWVSEAWEMMARSILREAEDGGGYELVCSPELEARLYREGSQFDIGPAASEFGGPAMLIGADPSLRHGPPTGEINRTVAEEGGFKYAYIDGCGHMLQLEKPFAAARIVSGFLQNIRN